MSNNLKRFILINTKDEFEYNKNKATLDIKFNRVAFIFFVFTFCRKRNKKRFYRFLPCLWLVL